MLALSKEERIDLVLLSGREGWCDRKIAEEFNLRHPYRQPICFTAVAKSVKRFKETGSVLEIMLKVFFINTTIEQNCFVLRSTCFFTMYPDFMHTQYISVL